MTGLLDDFRFAVRTFRRTPAFTATATLTLALGIGATTAIFSTVNAALLRPLPYPGWRDLRSVRTTFIDGRVTSGLLAPVELARLNDPALSLVGAAGALRLDATFLRDDGMPVRTLLYGVSEGYFEVFGLPMTLGRTFTHEHHVTGGPAGVVLSHHVWREMFGSDHSVIGRTLRFAEAAMTVVGVAAPDFDIPHGTDFWSNLQLDPQSIVHNLEGYLRVRSDAAPARVQHELATVMTGLARDFPSSDTGRAFVVLPLVDAVVGDLRPTLVVVLCATALLLLLACVNVTNLLLARGSARSREIAVRTALGATRGRIVRQLLTESVVLAVGSAAVGLVFAYAGIRLLLVAGASKLPRLDTVPFDGQVLLFTFAVLLVSGVLVGLAPAIRLPRANIHTVMIEGGRTMTGGRGALQKAMIVAEIALAVTLVAGAGWLVRSFANLRTVDPGFTADGRIIFDLSLPATRYREPAYTANWSRELLARLRQIGGVVAVGSTSSFPLRPDRDGTPFVEIQGEPTDPDRPRIARMRIVSADFFHSTGIKMASGRAFTNEDREKTAPVAIVNRAFERRYLGGKNAVMTQFSYGYPTINPRTKRTIVGVVSDVKYASLSADTEPAFYLVLDQVPSLRQSIVVHTSVADPGQIVPAIRDEARKMDPLLAIEFESVPTIVASTLSRQILGMALMIVFAVIALALAAVGIYGVIAYTLAQRTREVATRIALGASPLDVFWSMVIQGCWLGVVGAILGLVSAFATGRLISSWLFDVHASDPVVLTLTVIVVLVTAVVALVIPARRVASIDPVIALRSD